MDNYRRSERFEPEMGEDEVTLLLADQEIPGIAGDISQGGLCVIVMGSAGIEVGDEVTLQFRGQEVQAVARNSTTDIATTAYGLEWIGGPVPSLYA